MLTQPAAPLNLFRAADGELEVVEVSTEDGSTKRLCELGICPGKRISVVRQGNPALVAVGGSRFALAAELMQRVLVRPCR
ncbi:MAG: ferrous iron transport protein A [Planctomycetes bacterium]|nr:ferrous iron transport protein A [Planctomycetota bacterium]